VKRCALLDLTIGVAGAGIYDAAKAGAKAGIQQVKGKLSGAGETKK
jgi:hypothetical protein